ncbi:MAG: sigma-70 family RNA polymerase sigma factor [Candidatus Hydrogenedens sp.]|nr:sigma-70 family RNA polymerase sigma factor [Candidatus Hydrogenedens sp.]
MTQYNPDFWEIPTEIATLDRISADKALWFEDEVDRERRYAMREFFEGVASAVNELIEEELTDRQREIVKLYYFYGKTQEDIAVILNLTQSTVSRHLFGTTRDGKKVGGAIPKLRKAVDKVRKPAINEALAGLQERMAEAV